MIVTNKVWLALRRDDPIFEVLGIYSTEQLAIANCFRPTDVIGRIKIDEPAFDENKPWDTAYFPLNENSKRPDSIDLAERPKSPLEDENVPWNTGRVQIVNEGRRCVAVPVGIDLLANVMRKGNTTDRMVTLKGVPPDARHVGEFVDRKAVYFVFEHESFASVGYSERLPIMDVEICLLSNVEQRE